MNPDPTNALDDIDAALAAASVGLDDAEQRLAVAVFRLLATGAPVTAAAAAAATGMDTEHAAKTMHSWPAIFFDDDERVVGFSGLSLGEMPHRLRVSGVDLFAWCAFDPLFLAMILGETDVSTNDPLTGDTITYHIGRDATITELSHPEGVLSFLRPDRPWDNNVRTTFCHFVLQFTGPASAKRWTAEHPGTFTISLDDGVELARRFTARTFGAAVSTDT